jgi:hypothetical protein
MQKTNNELLDNLNSDKESIDDEKDSSSEVGEKSSSEAGQINSDKGSFKKGSEKKPQPIIQTSKTQMVSFEPNETRTCFKYDDELDKFQQNNNKLNDNPVTASRARTIGLVDVNGQMFSKNITKDESLLQKQEQNFVSTIQTAPRIERPSNPKFTKADPKDKTFYMLQTQRQNQPLYGSLDQHSNYHSKNSFSKNYPNKHYSSKNSYRYFNVSAHPDEAYTKTEQKNITELIRDKTKQEEPHPRQQQEQFPSQQMTLVNYQLMVSKHAQLEIDNAKLQLQMASLQNENYHLERKIDNITYTHKNEIKKLEDKASDIQRVLGVTKDQVRSLEHKNQELKRQIADLQKEKQDLKDKQGEQTMSILEKTVATLQSTVTQVQYQYNQPPLNTLWSQHQNYHEHSSYYNRDEGREAGQYNIDRDRHSFLPELNLQSPEKSRSRSLGQEKSNRSNSLESDDKRSNQNNYSKRGNYSGYDEDERCNNSGYRDYNDNSRARGNEFQGRQNHKQLSNQRRGDYRRWQNHYNQGHNNNGYNNSRGF